jgi:hypothetical protein
LLVKDLFLISESIVPPPTAPVRMEEIAAIEPLVACFVFELTRGEDDEGGDHASGVFTLLPPSTLPIPIELPLFVITFLVAGPPGVDGS